MKRPDSEPTPDAESEGTGLPGFRTWRGVYVFVLVVLTAYVVALAAFAHTFR